MLKSFSEHIDERFPFLKNSQLLVACSGGVDSVVLAQLLYRSNTKFDLAHCNFGLRDKESDDDEVFVGQLGKKFDCQVFSKKFKLKKHTGSTQLLARNLRYNWFHELLTDHAYDYVLTAHHADDSLETFLINISRGTGLDGLTGIPEQNGKIVRPLLPFSRKQILSFAKNQKLSWREDSSNAETNYLRNKIRHEITPLLKELHPTFLQNFQTSQEYLQHTQEWIDNQLINIKQKLFLKEDNFLKINIEILNKMAPLETSLFLLFKEYGFANTTDLKSLLKADSGKQLHSKTHRLVKDREHLLLTKITDRISETFKVDEHQGSVTHPINMRIETVSAIGKSSENAIYVDKETLNYPLLIRKWENGDYFYPFGMKGKKKVAKFFKDEKIDVLSKERQWLLCSGDKIVWVVGLRADDRFKVNAGTQQIVKFTWLG